MATQAWTQAHAHTEECERTNLQPAPGAAKRTTVPTVAQHR